MWPNFLKTVSSVELAVGSCLAVFSTHSVIFVHNILSAMVKACLCCSCSASQAADPAALWQSAEMSLACKGKSAGIISRK